MSRASTGSRSWRIDSGAAVRATGDRHGRIPRSRRSNPGFAPRPRAGYPCRDEGPTGRTSTGVVDRSPRRADLGLPGRPRSRRDALRRQGRGLRRGCPVRRRVPVQRGHAVLERSGTGRDPLRDPGGRRSDDHGSASGPVVAAHTWRTAAPLPRSALPPARLVSSASSTNVEVSRGMRPHGISSADPGRTVALRWTSREQGAGHDSQQRRGHA